VVSEVVSVGEGGERNGSIRGGKKMRWQGRKVRIKGQRRNSLRRLKIHLEGGKSDGLGQKEDHTFRGRKGKSKKGIKSSEDR